MVDAVKVALAQIDLIVGDVAGNTAKIIETARRARDADGADIVVFPELGISGYPPEDLLFHSGLRHAVEASVAEIRDTVSGVAVLIGFPEYEGDAIYNACAVLNDGKVLAHYRKQLLPNYAVFDEERYFEAGKDPAVFKLNGIRIGLNICEDVWGPGPMARSRSAGAECVLVINGSPFQTRSQDKREAVVRTRIEENGVPVVYVNHVGGQDELVFDGGSFVMDSNGEIAYRARSFEESVHTVVLEGTARGVDPVRSRIAPLSDTVERVYRALVLGTRDYVAKHSFPGVVVGLSGGIDSALVLAIACDAIGAERVRAVQMPFRYTSAMSQEDSAKQAAIFGVQYDVIPIEPMYDAAIRQLTPVLGETEPDATEENIQARCRLRDTLRRYGGRFCADQGLQQVARLRSRPLPQYARRGDPGTRDHAATVSGTPSGPERHGFVAELRHPRSDPCRLCRRGFVGCRNHRARLRPRRGHSRARDGQTQ
jgi:NAD+ synthase (glutamine-hydrolysing)